MLASVPGEAERLLRAARPEDSAVSWALRFAASLDGVLAVLSGMSNLQQLTENAATFRKLEPLDEKERALLAETARIYRESGPAGTADFSEYEKINPRGVSAADILDTYNSCMLQPVPTLRRRGKLLLLPEGQARPA